MISKNKLKELAVYKQHKHCDEDSVFIVEGVKMCHEAMVAKAPVKVVCATNSWLQEHPDLPINTEVYEVEQDSLARLSHLTTPNEVWMLVSRNLSTTLEGQPLTLALDHLQDPGNLGTIVRTADWFGVRHIVCSHDTVSCFNPKVVQSTMGSLFRTTITYTDLPDFLATCGKPVFGALLDGQSIWNPLSPIQLPSEGAVLVVGNESRGISAKVQACVTRRIAIPNLGGTAESLNASVACAILMAQFLQG